MEDPGFWWEFIGKVGAPIFAATLVVCLTEGQLDPIHAVLMATGLVMMAICHWRCRPSFSGA